MIEFEFLCSCGVSTTRQVYDSDEAATYLQVSGGTLYRWRKWGWIRFSSMGQNFYYQRQDLDECLRLRGYDRANSETEVILR